MSWWSHLHHQPVPVISADKNGEKNGRKIKPKRFTQNMHYLSEHKKMYQEISIRFKQLVKM